MELRKVQPAEEPSASDDFAHALGRQRQRVQQFLAAQRTRVAKIEVELAERIRRFHAELQAHEARLQQRKAECDAAEEAIRQQQRTLDAALAQQQAERAHLDEIKAELAKRGEELDDRHEIVVAKQYQTESQRKRLAHDFRAQRESLRKDVQRERADLLRRVEEFESRQADFERVQVDLERQQGELDRQRADLERQRGELESAPPAAESHETAPADAARQDELQRRLEMAMQDLRELKARNAELEKKLAARPDPAAKSSPGENMSWEAKKRQILAALEAEGDGETPERREERAKIQDVIRQTDEALAEKDRELAEMRQLLEQQSSTLGGVAVGAAALGDILDQDAIIREERENLKRMQAHWEEMLRQAEIDLSLERAKLARERTEVEEKARQVQSNTPAAAPGAGQAQPARGRWLARLGLKEKDQQ